jgi:hypothetical protein
MIKSLLDTVHEKDKIILEQLHSKIGENPNIAWYPSAGDDFRDVIEAVTRTRIKADLFFHTDYNKEHVKLRIGVVFKDNYTVVIIKNITELKFRENVNYFVNPDYVVSPDDSYNRPKIYLLDVEIECGHGIINKPVIYFFMENINFLKEVLLKFKLNLSHFIKVKEGCGYGGCKKSISVIYYFLGDLNVKHIFVDDRVFVDDQIIKEIQSQYKLKPVKYYFSNSRVKRAIADWSGFTIKILDVIISTDETLSDDDFNAILKTLQENW